MLRLKQSQSFCQAAVGLFLRVSRVTNIIQGQNHFNIFAKMLLNQCIEQVSYASLLLGVVKICLEIYCNVCYILLPF